MKIHHAPEYRASRARAYPDIASQLDAAMKGFAALSDAGIALPTATLEWIAACQAVKAQHPKPRLTK